MTAAESPALPPMPDDQADAPVACWREALVLPTYRPESPSRYPAFLDRRVYQGSSGKVYPLPFYEAVANEAVPTAWDAIHLENEWLRLVVLPELGGRIHIGYDKARDYDFFYRPEEIKPALVGLAGPWLSGGVEFNWPQHHRPGTYLPTVAEVEHGDDGSVTVWCSDHDPMQRMKGTHGIRLHPDRATIEVLVRLTNRTELTQTFLWWANVAAEVHDDYQSLFPHDVHFVADHANRATVAFPRADGPYYGIDYPERVSAERPDADRLDWYRNIPVPTSYMVLDTDEEFFGGYDHRADAGFVHWASRDVSPGKKQWTWGNAPFGWAWDRNLSDDARPYVELMAGVYTNNQPDFTFIAPGETKTFTQIWYPIGGMGPAQQATDKAAAHLSVGDGGVRLGLCVASPLGELVAVLRRGDEELGRWEVGALRPGSHWSQQVEWDGESTGLRLRVTASGQPVLEVGLGDEPSDFVVPPPAREPAPPAEIASCDELYLVGVHLDQYRHATRSPEPYWLEALRRDPGDQRCNTALGLRCYRRGDHQGAEAYLRAAVDRQNMLNLNPRDGEPHYLLGLVLARLGKTSEALRWLARSAWDGHWAGPAALAAARIELAAGHDDEGVRKALEAVELMPRTGAARVVAALALHRVGRADEAGELLASHLGDDRLDLWARHCAGQPVQCDPGSWLDVAREYLSVGAWQQALEVLDQALQARHVEGQTSVTPLVHYHRARALVALGRDDEAVLARQEGQAADATWCLPVTLDDVDVLVRAVDADPDDARAHGLLGSWCYHHGRFDEARRHWRRAAECQPDPVVLRNLGLDAYNQLHDHELASRYYQQAASLAGPDAKLLSEIDQLAQRLRRSPEKRLGRLQEAPDRVAQRDDLCGSMARLLVLTGRADQARELLAGRRFQPWEGGEGVILAAWDAASLALAREASAEEACELVRRCFDPPQNLGEARHPLANAAHLHLALGDALARLGDEPGARQAWQAATASTGDFQEMAVTQHSDLSWFAIMAARRLGDDRRAEELTAGLRSHVDELAASEPQIDYFATSLPNMLLFSDDLWVGRDDQVAVLQAQLALLDGDQDAPAVARARRQVPDHLGLHLITAGRLWQGPGAEVA